MTISIGADKVSPLIVEPINVKMKLAFDPEFDLVNNAKYLVVNNTFFRYSRDTDLFAPFDNTNTFLNYINDHDIYNMDTENNKLVLAGRDGVGAYCFGETDLLVLMEVTYDASVGWSVAYVGTDWSLDWQNAYWSKPYMPNGGTILIPILLTHGLNSFGFNVMAPEDTTGLVSINKIHTFKIIWD